MLWATNDTLLPPTWPRCPHGSQEHRRAGLSNYQRNHLLGILRAKGLASMIRRYLKYDMLSEKLMAAKEPFEHHGGFGSRSHGGRHFQYRQQIRKAQSDAVVYSSVSMTGIRSYSLLGTLVLKWTVDGARARCRLALKLRIAYALQFWTSLDV